MQFVDIEKKDGGAFLHRYDLHYIDRTGCPRTYEMVSRDRNIDSLEHLQHHRTDAVVMVLTDAAREHIALIHEFRMELGQRIYGLPGGLIEPGETPEQAARRELREETGIDAAPEELHLLGSIREPSAFSDCYLVRRTLPADSLTLQEGETDAACWVSFWRFETMIHEGLIPPPVALRYGAMLAALQAEVGRDAWLEPEPGSGREDNA